MGRLHRLVIGLLLATGLASAVVAVWTLGGQSADNATGLSGLAIVLIALLTRLGLEVDDASSRRRCRPAEAPAARPRRP
jgi:hypothetical protein